MKLDVNCSYGLYNVFLGGFVSFLIGDDMTTMHQHKIKVLTLTGIREYRITLHSSAI